MKTDAKAAVEEIRKDEAAYRRCAEEATTLCEREGWLKAADAYSRSAQRVENAIRAASAEVGEAAYANRWGPFGGEPPLADFDPTRTNQAQGLYRKFDVRRSDGSDKPGGKHDGCEYFVLDLTHDQHAKAALAAYSKACRPTHPILAEDLWQRYDLDEATPPPAAERTGLSVEEVEALERFCTNFMFSSGPPVVTPYADAETICAALRRLEARP